ncbi:hypothetical protein MKW92_018832 [Papaver armeniacum]|nr:hypothetical protein MKW92_018832 [Papaver armeniacum]
MGSDTITGHQQLHVYLFPVPAQGHMIPTVDIARLLAARGLKSTVICTPLNAVSVSKTTERDRLSGLHIDVQTIPFPAAEVGLPEGIESMDKLTSSEMVPKFMIAIALLQQPFEQLLEEHRPDFVIAGMFLPWATESAAKFGIPRIVFHGTSCFSLSVGESLNLYKPYEAISADADPHSPFVIPGLPDKIEMTMAQLPDNFKVKNVFSEMMEKVRESELNSYGVLVNSFYELEPAYAEHYRNILGRKTWHIGPVSLRNTDTSDKAQRGKKSTIDEHYVLNWLNSKEPNSVLYVSFGSVSRVSNDQLLELAMGLENSGYSFIWVVRKIKTDDEESFLPKGFQERIEGRGLIIRDWAPQVLILDHEAVGGFMTHCGWNSTLEGISAGVPMITWPMFAEQFYNEKFITQVIKIGAPLGAKEYNMWVDAKKVSLVKNETIATVVTQLMGDGEEAKEMRQRAKEIGEMAKRSVEEGGSSYSNLTTFIEEMKHQLHVFIFPATAPGHLIPMINIAKLFAARGVKTTIISTPLHAITLSKTINHDRLSGLDINIQIIPFPAVEVGLPEGTETVNQLTSPDMIPKFFLAVSMLEQPFEKLLEVHRPDIVVADMFFPWATEAAAKFGIPRFVFHGINIFCQCVDESLRINKPFESITDDKESFLVPDLPDKIEMTKSQVPQHIIGDSMFSALMEKIRESEQKSYGVLVNSFYELEPEYVDYYKNAMGIRSWQIGPLSLQNNDSTLDKAERQNESSTEEHSVLKWLDSKKPNSVIYVSFGSMSKLPNDQLTEIATGLEDSGCSFIWVVRKTNSEEEGKFLPEGFEERMEGKGLIIREWAPQVLILDHPAVGGFMTHCGWNSILEGITAGVPMITWPMFAEQFYNEKLLTQVLKIGSQVGAGEWNGWIETANASVKKEQISKAVTQLMRHDGDENKEMRKRVAELGEKAKRAVKEDGSSYTQFTALIEELKMSKK